MKKISLIALSVLSLSAICALPIANNVPVNKIVNAETNNVDSKVSSVKEAFQKLANSKNYSIKVSSKTGPLDIESNLFYTENGFYDDFLGDEYGYYKTNDGVVKFDRYARKFTPSALLKDKSGNVIQDLWGSDLFCGFANFDLTEFTDSSSASFDISKKKNKIAFMRILSINVNKYDQIQKIHVEIDGDINTLKFSIKLSNGEQYSCSVYNFGTTKIDYLDKQIAAGKTYYTPDTTMAKIINLFNGLNYTHFMYDESFSKTDYVGYEKFTEGYFLSGYTSEYLKKNPTAAITSSGMVGLSNYVVNDKLTMNGSYWTYVSGETFAMVSSFYYNEDPYVPNVYVYPTFLEALQESQYFESAGTEGTYYTNKISVISDFCTNFQLWDGLSNNNFTPCGLFVKYDKSFNNQDTVTFSIQYDYYGIKGTTDYVFSDFGKTEEKVLEQKYVKKYLSNYYNAPKAVVNVEGVGTKKFNIAQKVDWLLDDTIECKYEYAYITNAEAGTKLDFALVDGETQTPITVTPDTKHTNNNYVIENGEIKIKETGNTYVYLTKYTDGTWTFQAVK